MIVTTAEQKRYRRVNNMLVTIANCFTTIGLLFSMLGVIKKNFKASIIWTSLCLISVLIQTINLILIIKGE